MVGIYFDIDRKQPVTSTSSSFEINFTKVLRGCDEKPFQVLGNFRFFLSVELLGFLRIKLMSFLGL